MGPPDPNAAPRDVGSGKGRPAAAAAAGAGAVGGGGGSEDDDSDEEDSDFNPGGLYGRAACHPLPMGPLAPAATHAGGEVHTGVPQIESLQQTFADAEASGREERTAKRRRTGGSGDEGGAPGSGEGEEDDDGDDGDSDAGSSDGAAPKTPRPWAPFAPLSFLCVPKNTPPFPQIALRTRTQGRAEALPIADQLFCLQPLHLPTSSLPSVPGQTAAAAGTAPPACPSSTARTCQKTAAAAPRAAGPATTTMTTDRAAAPPPARSGPAGGAAPSSGCIARTPLRVLEDNYCNWRATPVGTATVLLESTAVAAGVHRRADKGDTMQLCTRPRSPQQFKEFKVSFATSSAAEI